MMTMEQLDLSDIAAFADPFTEHKIRRTKEGARIDLSRNGRASSFELKSADGRVVEGVRQRVYPNIDSLLASERFANLAQFAETQLRSAAKKQVRNPMPASIRIGSGTINDLSPVVHNKSKAKLRLVLLDGPAGIGKTFQIERLVASHAAAYKKGEAIPLVLHVTSRGRRLSNLSDVMAAATQDVNAAFFAKHVPMLVRRGLLCVAIDGFDELVDADGYDDSWLALRQFLGEVGLAGTVLLAARDTFVEEQELLARIERTKAEIDLEIGEVRGPEPAQARDWLSTSPNWKASDLQSDTAEDLLRPGSYALRPFFLRELWNSKGWADIADVGPRTLLVNRLLSREATLIAQQLGGTTKDAVLEPLSSVLQEVAVHMASREVDAVEVEHLGFITQFSFDGVVDDTAIRKLMHKSGSLALLELTPDKGMRKFPHSEIQHYFFAKALLGNLSTGVPPSVIRRHLLNAEELEVILEVFATTEDDAISAVKAASALLASEVSGDSLAPNLSALVIAGLALGYIPRVDFAEAIEATFGGMSPVGKMSASRINRLDASGADLTQLEFIDVEVETLVVDSGTDFGATLPILKFLEVREPNDVRLLKRNDISEYIKSRRNSALSDADSPSAKLLEKVARRAVRHFYLRVSGDEDDGATLLSSSLWPGVQKILERHNRVEVVRSKQMHGRPSPLIRVKNPLALLDPSDRDTKKIVAELVAAERRAAH